MVNEMLMHNVPRLGDTQVYVGVPGRQLRSIMCYFLVRREATTDKRRVDEVRSVRIQDEVNQGVLGKVQKSQLPWGEVVAPMGHHSKRTRQSCIH